MATAAFTFWINNTPPADTIDVLRFTGEEGISQLPRFEIDFHYVTEDATKTPSSLIGESATLSIDWGSGAERTIYGDVVELQMGRRTSTTDTTTSITTYTLWCRATLMPAVHRLTLNRGSRVFQGQSVIDIVKAVLNEADFVENTTYVVDVDNTAFDKREYCIQYEESDFAFISRLMEYEGLSYFFLPSGDVFFITDKLPADLATQRTDYANVGSYAYNPQNGLRASGNTVLSFLAQQKAVTSTVRLGDYNYEDFSEELLLPDTSTVPASPPECIEYRQFLREGRDFSRPQNAADKLVEGTTYPDQTSYSEQRMAQVGRLATVRQQEVTCQQEVFTGQSEWAKLASGFPFTLTGYYLSTNPVIGEDFLVTRLTHFGGLSSEAQVAVDGTVITTPQTIYYNQFTCIRQNVPYRTPRVTPVPRVPGVITAKIERHSTTVIDQEGRYKVRLPFEETAGSVKRVRMAQPYSGPDYGIHFPNPAGAEAVIAFIGGDIDRPIILSTLPGKDHHTPVPNTKLKLSSQNPKVAAGERVTFDEKKNVIRTKTGHQLVMDDANGTRNVGITLQTGNSDPGGALWERNVYWKSKLELGGYSVKSPFNHVLDIITEADGWLMPMLLRDHPHLLKLIPAFMLTYMATGDYPGEAYGDTKPVGAKLSTLQKAQVIGKNGVSISCPNLLGFFEGPMAPPLLKQNDPRIIMTSLMNFIRKSLWEAVYKKGTKELKDLKEKLVESSGKDYIWWLLAKWDYEKKENWLRKSVTNALDLPGISIDSTGPIKLTSLDNITAVVGQGGYRVESFGDIKQTADLDVSLEAKQKISIKTRGTPYGRGETLFFRKGLENAASKIKQPIPKKVLEGALKIIGFIADLSQPVHKYFPRPKSLPILMENENGDILLHTKGKGEIDPKEKGNIKLDADKGHIEAYAEEGHVKLCSKTSTVHLGEEMGLLMKSDKWIQLQCGDKSYIRLDPDGKITIMGTEILINGKSMTIKGSETLNLEVTPTPLPKPPEIIDYDNVAPPEAPKLVTPSKEDMKNPDKLLIINKRNQIIAEKYKRDLELNMIYQKFLLEQEAYDKLNEQFNQSPPTASIELKAMPGDIAVECTNYTAESKLKYEYKGLMINGEATGIHTSKGTLAKIN